MAKVMIIAKVLSVDDDNVGADEDGSE